MAVFYSVCASGLIKTLKILNDGLKSRFQIANPRIGVLALNPHAGEDGYLGREEINIITAGIKPAGYHKAQLDVYQLAPGSYFYQLQVDDAQITKRLEVIK